MNQDWMRLKKPEVAWIVQETEPSFLLQRDFAQLPAKLNYSCKKCQMLKILFFIVLRFKLHQKFKIAKWQHTPITKLTMKETGQEERQDI